MPRVVHFEIHAGDPERAKRFYERLFGWGLDRYGPEEYWLVTTGPNDQPGINGGLLRRGGVLDGQAVIAYVCTVDVADLEASLALAIAEGGSIALERTAVPGIGWLAYIKDTEGNILGLLQSDSKAK